MKEYRGLILQLATLASLVVLAVNSKNGDTNIIHFAMGTIGGIYGVTVARARSEAGAGVAGGPAAIGRSIPPLITGMVLAITFGLWLYGCAAAKPLLVDLGTAECQELAAEADAGIDPELIKLACKDAAGTIVNLILPRKIMPKHNDRGAAQ